MQCYSKEKFAKAEYNMRRFWLNSARDSAHILVIHPLCSALKKEIEVHLEFSRQLSKRQQVKEELTFKAERS